MSNEQDPIPELNTTPTHLSTNDLARGQRQYIRHVRAEIEQYSGPGSFERLMSCILYFEGLKELPSTIDRMMHVLGSSSVEWASHRAIVEALADPVKQEPVALIDLVADFHQIAAEVGDLALRMSATAEPDEAAFIRARVHKQLNFETWKDVRNCYQTAYTLYGRCFFDTILEVRKAGTNPTDPRHAMGPILDQLAVKHIGMATRLLLLRIAEFMESNGYRPLFKITSGDSVLPHLPRFPEARGHAAQDIEVSATRQVMESMMSLIFNNPRSIVTVYGNIGLYATILGDYRRARQAVSIATPFARGAMPEVLRQLSPLIDLLDPPTAA